MKLFRIACLGAVFGLMAACGTLSSVPKTNRALGYDLRSHDSKCSSVPRIYSGVAYDFCRLHADANGGMYLLPQQGFFLLDMMLLSPIADTVVLPVSVYQQVRYGNAVVERGK